MDFKTIICATLLTLFTSSSALTAVSNAPASGAISAPRGTLQGKLTATAAALDPDGLYKVSLVLTPGGRPLVLCHDDDPTQPCHGTSGTWTRNNVEPSLYGVTSNGSMTVALWVQDETGWVSLVAQETVVFSFATGNAPSGQIIEPIGTYAGDVLVRAKASDPDGLSRVTIDFGPGAAQIVLCDPCSGTTGDWVRSQVDPAASPGAVTATLRVRDGNGNELTVAQQDLVWQPVSGNLAGGQLSSPNDFVVGEVMLVAAAQDPDRLDRVAVELGNSEIELCGSTNPCLGSADSWRRGGVDPGAHGSTSGRVDLTLAVTDDLGGHSLVLSHGFDWQPASLRASSGNINGVTDNGDGTIDVPVSVRDPDGLYKVSLVFVPGGPAHVLCFDGTAAPCPSGTGQTAFLADDVDPRSYGAGAGSVTLGLWVQDQTGRFELVDDHAFTYSPPPTPEAVMLVTPGSSFTASGEEGGPFTSLSHYAVENTGTTDLSYDVDVSYAPTTGSWLNIGNASGSLSPGAVRSVTLAFNAAVAESLAPGTYTAVLAFGNQTNGLGDTDRTVTLTVDPAVAAPPKIAGRITDGAGNPIEGVRIDGMPVVHWTDANGEYGRVVGEGWSGTVTPSKAGFTFAPSSRSYTNVSESKLDENYLGDGQTLVISGRVTSGASGLAGVVLDGLPGPPTTATDGTYSAVVPFRFTGRVTPMKTGYVFTPSFLDYNDLRGFRSDQDYTAVVQSVTLSGRVTRGSLGLSGVWLSGLPGGVLTASDGSYSASVPLGWSGTVTPQRTGYAFTPVSRDYVNVQGGEPSDYVANSLPAGSHRLWIVTNDTEMNEATIRNRSGDMILVEPGTYIDVDIGGIDPEVTLLSTGGADVTLFRRDWEHRFTGDDIVVDGFTFESTRDIETVQVYGDRVQIRNSRFRPVAGEYGVRVDEVADFLIEGSVFERGGGLLLHSGSSTGEMVVRNNEFKDLWRGFGAGSNTGMRARIENNLFKNMQDGVDLRYLQQATIRNNIFANITGQAVDLDDISQQSTLAHNVFINNNQAIAVCDVSILVYNSIFQNNGKGIDGCSRGTVNVHHDLIWQGTWLWAGPTYIRDEATLWRDECDPQFIDPADCDFQLAASSCARGRGTGGSDLGAYGGALGQAWAPVPGTPQTPPALLSITLGGPQEVSVGDTISFDADGDFESGFYAPLEQRAIWTSSNDAVLHSLGNGNFEARAPGTATVTTAYGGRNETLPITVLGAALVLSVSDVPDPVPVGGQLAYTVDWRNDGPGVARGTRLVVTYDPQTSSPSPSMPPDIGTDNVWTLGDLPPGATGSLTVQVDVATQNLVEGDFLAFNAALEPAFLTSLTTAVETAILGQADLVISKTCDAVQVFPGDEITCTLTWSNQGTGTARGVQVVESYPTGTSFLDARPVPSSGDALWLLGDAGIDAEGSLEIDLRIDADAVGDLVNSVEIRADDADLDDTDNTATFTVEVEPLADLALTSVADPDPVEAEALLTYHHEVTNHGPSVATGLTLEQLLPPGSELTAQPEGDGWTCAETAGASGVTLTCTRSSLAAGSASEVTVTVSAPPSLGDAVSEATVGAVAQDPDLDNNDATVTVTVLEPPPAAILLVDDDDDAPDVRSFYSTALDSLGLDYDIWDTGASDDEPTVNDLAPYGMVLWFTGDLSGGFAGPGPVAESHLAAYLDQGGCLLISSQDYLWDRGGATHDVPTPLMATYLGVASGISDVRQITITGSNLFAGRGPFTLSLPYGNFTDALNPDATARLAWSGDMGAAGVQKDGGVYRTSFWGFGLEGIPGASARADLVGEFLGFCAELPLFQDGFESGDISRWSKAIQN